MPAGFSFLHDGRLNRQSIFHYHYSVISHSGKTKFCKDCYNVSNRRFRVSRDKSRLSIRTYRVVRTLRFRVTGLSFIVSEFLTVLSALDSRICQYIQYYIIYYNRKNEQNQAACRKVPNVISISNRKEIGKFPMIKIRGTTERQNRHFPIVYEHRIYLLFSQRKVLHKTKWEDCHVRHSSHFYVYQSSISSIETINVNPFPIE